MISPTSISQLVFTVNLTDHISQFAIGTCYASLIFTLWLALFLS